MSRSIITLLFVFFIATLFFAPLSAGAQLPFGGDSAVLSIASSPENPRAFQTVTLSISNSSTDLDRSTIIWKLDGKEVKRGVGEKKLIIQTGALGSSSRIDVTVRKEEGGTLSDTFFIVPGNVDLVWEANTYVPPFYPGKALYPIQGEITVSAIPNLVSSKGVRAKAKDLYYQWSQDGKPIQELSGFGKDSITIFGPVILKPTRVSLVVSSKDNVLIGENALTLNPTEPLVLLYEDSPARGVLYEKALDGTVDMNSQDAKVVAVPYYFSVTKPNDGNITYSWILNDRTVGKQTENFLTLVSSSKDSGVASIAVDAQHTKRVFQIGGKAISLRFGNLPPNKAF